MLSLLLFISLAQASRATPLQSSPDLDQLEPFLTLTRTPSAPVIRIQVRIGTFRDQALATGGRAVVYWFDRTVRDLDRPQVPAERSFTSTGLCRGARQTLIEVEHLRMPEPDVPYYGRELRGIVVDGVDYQLEGNSIHADDLRGDFFIESNSGSPLAQWADRLLAVLSRCWRRI